MQTYLEKQLNTRVFSPIYDRANLPTINCGVAHCGRTQHEVVSGHYDAKARMRVLVVKLFSPSSSGLQATTNPASNVRGIIMYELMKIDRRENAEYPFQTFEIFNKYDIRRS